MPHFDLRFLARKLAEHQTDVFAVQIGAMDGVRGDPLRPLLRRYQWQALLVEPMPDAFEALQKNYAGWPHVVLANVAIAEHDGIHHMTRFTPQAVADGGVPGWAEEAATFMPERTALAWQDPAMKEQLEVPCMTLQSLVETYAVDRMDVLQIDAEGYDWHILKQLNFERFTPFIIHLEIVNLPQEEQTRVTNLLDKQGYLYRKAGYNLVAARMPLDWLC